MESAEALALFASEGVSALIATPHVALSLMARGEMAGRLAEIDRGWADLESVAVGRGTAIHRGAELRLDAADPDLSDDRLRLAGTRFVLVEFPYFTVPPRSTRTIAQIVRHGWLPIIAHPERYDGLEADLEVVGQWRDAGAYIQVNGAALLGRYGDAARTNAMRLLAAGQVDYLGSDYHARGRIRLTEYCDAITAMGGAEQVALLTATNPARVLEDERPAPVPPLSAVESGRD